MTLSISDFHNTLLGSGFSLDLSDIGILNINPRDITFHWTQPNSICSVSHYILTATNCGMCPLIAARTDSQITCTNISTDGRMCTFSVQVVGTIDGNQTVSTTAFLKGN